MTDEELAEFMRTRTRDSEQHSASNRRYVVGLAHERQIPIASHDDATLEHVEEAIADAVSVAEFPTTLEAARASHRAGMAVLMGGPNIVRGKSHSGNISALELAFHGVLDIVSSDYVPCAMLWGALKLHTAACRCRPPSRRLRSTRRAPQASRIAARSGAGFAPI